MDSLVECLKQTEKNKEKILNELSENLGESNPGEAFDYADKALKHSLVSGNKQEEAIALNNMGFARLNLGESEAAMEDFEKALRLSERIAFDIGKIRSLNNQGLYFLLVDDYEAAEAKLLVSIELCKASTNEKLLLTASNHLGRVYYNWGKFALALEQYNNGIEIAQKLRNNYELASLFNNIGLVYDYLGNYEQVLIYYDKALELSKRTGDESIMSTLLVNIGVVYSNWSDYTRAMEYYRKSLPYVEKSGNQLILASVYLNMGVSTGKLGDKDSSFFYYNEALKIFRESDNHKGIANALRGIGKYYMEQQEYDQSESFLNLALKENEHIDNKVGTIGAYHNLGNLYLLTKDYEKASDAFNRSLVLSVEIRHLEFIKDNYLGLSNVSAASGNPAKALDFYKRYKEIEDSVFSEKRQKKIVEMEVQFEMEKKRQEVEMLQQENKYQELKLRSNNYLLFGLVIVIVAIILIAILVNRQNRLKNQQVNIMLEQKLLRAQMNPHFIFNSLTAIQKFIYKSDKKQAGNVLSSFARLMRLILENSREEYVLMDKEIQTLEYYLQLQEVRFKDKFSYSIYIDEKIERESMAVPPMLAQPFIENAIEHGILPAKSDNGHIEVSYELDGDLIVFKVEDNGIGRVKAGELKQNDKDHYSLATAITNERLKILNKRNNKNIKLDIVDLQDENGQACGTRVIILIPYKTF